MALLLAWVSLGACLLLVVACVALYLDGKGARADLAAWRLTTEARLEDYAARLAAIESAPGAPPLERSTAGGPSPASPPRRAFASVAPDGEDDAGRAAMLPGGELGRASAGRPTLVGMAPPVAFAAASSPARRGERVMIRFYKLAVLHKTTHCCGATCDPSGRDCTCGCETCACCRRLLAQAEQETAHP